MDLCVGCKLDFRGVGAFDAHRVFANPKVEDWKTRRCLTRAELLKLGMDEKDGRLGFPVSPEKAAFFAARKIQSAKSAT